MSCNNSNKSYCFAETRDACNSTINTSFPTVDSIRRTLLIIDQYYQFKSVLQSDHTLGIHADLLISDAKCYFYYQGGQYVLTIIGLDLTNFYLLRIMIFCGRYQRSSASFVVITTTSAHNTRDCRESMISSANGLKRNEILIRVQMLIAAHLSRR